MNKKILVSLSVIGVVAAIAIGGTIAYFSDTETSTGNTFTAGSIDLTIDNHCIYNGDECVCQSEVCYWDNNPALGVCTCTWDLKNLAEGNLFFNFSDLKPGDWGEDTVSIHVDNNDAWACVWIQPTKDDDVTCTEPEMADDDTCDEPNDKLWDGDLAAELNFFFWADMCDDIGGSPGDNIFQYGCDTPLMWGPANNIVPEGEVYTLADADENNVGGKDTEPLTGEEDYYIGKAWCFGDWDPIEGWHCDGSEVDNASQSDSLMGNIVFYAVQSRNNSNFQCGVNWPTK